MKLSSLILFLVAISLHLVSHAQEVPEAIKTLISRPTQISSGIFNFHTESGLVTGQDVWIDPRQPSDFSLTVKGNDWVKRYPGSNHIRLNHDGTSASYYQAGMNTPTANQRLTLGAHEGSVESKAESVEWKMCSRMGALPVKSVSDFISKTTPKSESEQDIGGVDCRVYEYTIPKTDMFKVLTAVHPSCLDAESLTLRLALAKEFGFALVRYEVIGPLGSFDVTESSEFIEVAPAIFLPKKWRRKYGPENGVAKSILTTIELVDFNFVNKTLPKDAFEYDVPAGTSVTDSRPGVLMRRYRLDLAIKLSSLLGK